LLAGAAAPRARGGGGGVGAPPPPASNTELASLMVGRAVELTVQKQPPRLGEGGLEVRDLRVLTHHGAIVVDAVSFDVRPGEVLAIAGVQGNGQTELVEAIVGLAGRVEGSISLDGTELVGRSVRGILDAGVGFVPEDRNEDGLVGEFSVAENLILDRSSDRAFVRWGTIMRKTLDRFARDRIAEYDIRTQGPQAPAATLSGGNQQKVVIARELDRELRLLVAAQPTRGVDVGSIEFIHKRIIETRDSGVPVIVVSTELDEVTALADRIAVMYRGAIVGVVPGDTPRDILGLMMAGASDPEVAA
ncbi:ATP-binding cassette domain-containing protein, partial [Microbacterium sp. zg.Y818]|uniref:ATP-binding cassette domain-containing protein n=1 Tax=Microbacterium sp. zg.Y818 TaxID=2969412 RepID=UPI00214B60D2